MDESKQIESGEKVPSPDDDIAPVQAETNLGGLYSHEISTARLCCLYIGYGFARYQNVESLANMAN